MTAIAETIKLFVLTALIFEVSARTGAGFLPWFSRRRLTSWETMALGFFSGWGLMAAAVFGLALTRLFYPTVIVACLLAMFAVSRGTWKRGVLLAAGFAAVKGLSWPGRAWLALGALLLARCVFPTLLLPVTGVDAYTYHLGAPWQYLISHGIQTQHVSWLYHLTMPAEMFNTISLILGDERLARWFSASHFLAATVFTVGFFTRRGETHAAWLSPLLMFGTLHCLLLLPSCKSDMPAAALFVVGALLSLEGSWMLSGLLMGACMAAKLVTVPLVATWLLFRPVPRRWMWRVSAVLLLPSLGWLLKAFAVTGNPFGLAAAWINSYDWGPANNHAWQLYNDKFLGENIGFAKLPENWVAGMYRENFLLLALLPGVIIFSRRRKEIAACVLAQFVTMKMMSEPRFLFASILGLSWIAGSGISRIGAGYRRIVACVLGAAALGQIFARYPVNDAKWNEIKLPASEYRSIHLTTYEETIGMLENMDPGRILLLGEISTYRVPGRVIFGGALGETPLIWKMAKESGDVAELARKFRQLGADTACQNYITAELIAFDYVDFPWDRRMIRLYADYLKSFQSVAGFTGGNDFNNGGFYIYRIRRNPLKPAQDNFWFLPGAERFFNPIKNLDKMGLMKAALEESKAMLELLPDVGQVWNLAGHYYLVNGDAGEAFRHLEPFIKAGMVDTANLPDYGAAARKLGRLELAEAVLRDALTRFRPQRDFICAELGMVYLARARAGLAEGNPGSAERMLDEAERYLGVSPVDRENARFRRQVSKLASSLRGEIRAAARAQR